MNLRIVKTMADIYRIQYLTESMRYYEFIDDTGYTDLKTAKLVVDDMLENQYLYKFCKVEKVVAIYDCITGVKFECQTLNAS